MNYVIVGSSVAATGCIEGIRSIDKEGTITVIGSEKYHTYSRPLISYLLEGKTDLERMKYRKNDFYEENNVKTLFGKTCVEIDKENKKVTVDDGTEIKYDKLLLGTGSYPFVPETEGLDTVSKKFTFYTLDDALSLKEAINENSRVLILGAGLIGLKCAEGIYKHVGKIYVTDLSHKILASILDDEGAGIVRAHLESHNITFFTGTKVVRFEGDKAIFEDGKTLEFDVLVTAVGVRANIALFTAAGGKAGRGIAVDNKMETELKDIYAAGDCVESTDISSGEKKVVAILPNAYKGGFTAGVNMAGGNGIWDKSCPMNAIGFFGLHIITAGSYIGYEYIVKNGENYKKMYIKDNALKGFIIIGNVEKAGIYTSLVREKTPLDSIDFELIVKEPGLAAFERKYRDKVLGGV